MHRMGLSVIIFCAAAKMLHAHDAVKTFRDQVAPILRSHCTSCHGGDSPKASMNLSGERTLEQLQAEHRHWMRVLEQIEDGLMPPKGEKPLIKAEKLALTNWIRGEFYNLIVEQRRKEGRSKMRRLSRNEYANTIQDLFGIRPAVVRDLPVDGRVDGYDKVSDAVPMSSAHVSGYLKIAEEMMNRFPLGSLEETTGEIVHLFAIESEQSPGHILELDDGWMVSFNTDTTSGPLRRKIVTANPGELRSFPGIFKPGHYRLRMSVYGYQTDKPLPFGVYAGNVWTYPQLIELRKVLEAPPGTPAILETDVYLRSYLDSDVSSNDGIRLIPLGLGVPVPKNSQASACKGPGLALQWVDVIELDSTAPGDLMLFADVPPSMRDAFRSQWTWSGDETFRKELLSVARKTYARVGARLYRRDLTDLELQAMLAAFNARLVSGMLIRQAFLGEITELMISPDFLCMIEQPGPLGNFALATRLSYFLWSSTPDEDLMEIARAGNLTNPVILREQTERLLKDPRSRRFVQEFTDQWLGLWAIDNTTPDRDLYPEYNDLLKISSVNETQATFRLMLDENRSTRDFVAPKWALVNHELARHYELPAVSGFELQEVMLPTNTPFGGFWTQAATMKVTANGTLTSPVKRGVWVVERLLGTPIPSPPPNIEPLDPDTRGAKTLREKLAKHRGAGSCAACHAKFDPYGFPLESFDVIGNYRTKYRVVDRGKSGSSSAWKEGLPVDCSGTTPDGKKFSSIKPLRLNLAGQPEQLAYGVTRHLVTYATGTPATQLDHSAIEEIVRLSKNDDYGLRTLVHNVIQSELFCWK